MTDRHVEVFRDYAGLWRWRRVATGNREKTLTGESHRIRANAIRAARTELPDDPIRILDDAGNVVETILPAGEVVPVDRTPEEAYDAGHRDGLEEGTDLPRYDVGRVRELVDELDELGLAAPGAIAAELREALGLELDPAEPPA